MSSEKAESRIRAFILFNIYLGLLGGFLISTYIMISINITLGISLNFVVITLLLLANVYTQSKNYFDYRRIDEINITLENFECCLE